MRELFFRITIRLWNSRFVIAAHYGRKVLPVRFRTREVLKPPERI